jgi:hypothetical protein
MAVTVFSVTVVAPRTPLTCHSTIFFSPNLVLLSIHHIIIAEVLKSYFISIPKLFSSAKEQIDGQLNNQSHLHLPYLLGEIKLVMELVMVARFLLFWLHIDH